ncbi:MAG: hypothetical protein A3F83_16960 [Candidatus Glassbacteria bacterium RIFCSPLOWO2_12_FULL_58_11]|uniref:Uncharacterized protein n=2 Tax=Candidatus Glassiibacteriota TaxID=1817805 RepID=A0A1F5YLU4_9BACT|nr:MAG: hypothetical protein A2Z86_09780 [Candidatus Glassbacteria bacterium GWA2_58_10]OGG01064.1 MAG: hypothetical protein A3F83_16960 [Candidatus Glassbacteria bacterium RIFCSPLOWO2_12_FULL_58_11]
MHCKQIARQTKGEVTEIQLAGLHCNMAEICRRKGICALSPFAFPEQLNGEAKAGGEKRESPPRDDLSGYYEVLEFKNSLGYQWVRVENFTAAVSAAEKYCEKGQPKYIRRVEIFQLPG